MTTQFQTLLTVAVSHSYYTESCEDFDFVIPADTGRIMRNGKLIARTRNGKFYVLYEAKEDGNPWIRLDGAKLRIALRLVNRSLSNFTELDFDPSSAVLVYSNDTSPGSLDTPEEAALVGQALSLDLSRTGRPVTTSLLNADGGVVQTESITESSGRASVSIDLTGLDPGRYSVREVYSAETLSTIMYHDPELLQAGVFAILDLTIDADFYTTAAKFTVAFEAREEPLKYYVVARNYSALDFDRLTVTDTGSTEDVRDEVLFVKVPVSAFSQEEIPASLIADDDVQLALFKSTSSIPRREKARKNIQLSKKGEVIISHLPQPSANSTNAEFVIHITKP